MILILNNTMTKTSRKTKQKDLINKEINKFKTFFKAEDLYKKIRTIDKNIGLATIYRALKELRKNKKIHSYTCENKLVYSKENKSHCHFICEETGELYKNESKLYACSNQIVGSHLEESYEYVPMDISVSDNFMVKKLPKNDFQYRLEMIEYLNKKILEEK